MLRNTLKHLDSWFADANRKPLILRGARQVGKSTLVRMFAKQQNLELLEINLEKFPLLDEDFRTLDITRIEQSLSAILRKPIHGTNQLLFLDEIQSTPHVLPALRYFYEDRPGLPVIAAGSLLDFLLADHEFSMPVGRVQYCHMGPLKFDEFLEAKNETFLVEKLRSWKLGDLWPQALHDACYQEYRNFIWVGGMPEAVQRHVTDTKGTSWRDSQDSIITTYRDDFVKYAKKSQLIFLHKVFDELAKNIGKKIVYSELLPGVRSAVVKQTLELLFLARVYHCCLHTSANGIPLGAEVKAKFSKVFHLDVGLLNRMLGLDLARGFQDYRLVNEGILAEQFIAQHLSDWSGESMQPQLYYWLREEKNTNAEIDFLVQRHTDIIPIEVKSGKSGALKSLLQFAGQKGSNLAVRFSNAPTPGIEKISHKFQIGKGTKSVSFELLSLPHYFVGELKRILAQ